MVIVAFFAVPAFKLNQFVKIELGQYNATLPFVVLIPERHSNSITPATSIILMSNNKKNPRRPWYAREPRLKRNIAMQNYIVGEQFIQRIER